MRGIRWWALVNGALVALFIGAALFDDDGVVRHERLSEELDRLHVLNAQLDEQNGGLRTEAKALRHDERYVEHVIRDELGWVAEDEVVFIFEESETANANPHR